MARSYRICEPLYKSSKIEEPFVCGVPGGTSIDIFRLLTGSCNLVRLADDKIVKLRFDYLVPCQRSRPISERSIVESIFGHGVSIADASNILSRFRGQNIGFFAKLEVELAHCMFALSEKSCVEAFLYFYRALEKLAVAFPLMYVIGQPDFEKLHSMLKPLFEGEKNGELAFVTKFSKFVSKKSDFLNDYNITFSFRTRSLDEFDAIKREIERIISDSITKNIKFDEGSFDIPYSETAPFLIECRNKLFHNSNSGQKNFDIDRIGGSLILCESLVDGGLHWLTRTYVEVLRNRLSLL